MPASATVSPSSQSDGAGGGDGPVAGPALDLLVGAARHRAGSAPASRRASRRARRTVSYGPRWNSRTGTSRLPPGPRMHRGRARAPRTRRTGPRTGRPGRASRRPCRGCARSGRRSPARRRGRSGSARRRPADSSSVGVPGQRADDEVVAVDADVGELGEVVDVDQRVGSGQPQLHHRQQAVPAGDDPGLGAELLQQAIACSTLVARSYVNGAGTCMRTSVWGRTDRPATVVGGRIANTPRFLSYTLEGSTAHVL